MSLLAGQSMFNSLLGPAFDRLPPTVRKLHAGGAATYSGGVVVRRGAGWLSRLTGWITGLPPSGQGTITVDIQPATTGESWVRRFGAHVLRSSLTSDHGALCEHIGPMRFWFQLAVEGDRLRWTVVRAKLLALPLPVALFRHVVAVEAAEDARYTFDVSATVPGVGLLVHYRGWLDVQ